MSAVFAVTVEIHPDMEGNAEGIDDVGCLEGVIVGSRVGDPVRKVTQNKIFVKSRIKILNNARFQNIIYEKSI